MLIFGALPVATAADDSSESLSAEASSDDGDLSHVTPSLTARDVIDDERTQDPSRDDLEPDEAAELAQVMNAALEAEDEGRYEEAQNGFVESYEIFPHSNLLLSVARVSDRADDPEMALKGYRRFVERQPDYENREQLERRIQELEEELAVKEEKVTADETEAPGARDSRRDKLIPSSTRGRAGAGLAVLGLTSMVVGTATAASVSSDFDALEQLADQGDREGYDQLAGDIDSRQSRGKFFLYGGMGLTVIGGALLAMDRLYFDNPSASPDVDEISSRVTLEPVSSNGATLRWTRSF